MNTHATIEELPFLCNGEVNRYNTRGIVRKMGFLLGPPRGYITRILDSWERTEMAVEVELRRNCNESVEFRDASLAGYELGS
jgi:hypothetical protein